MSATLAISSLRFPTVTPHSPSARDTSDSFSKVIVKQWLPSISDCLSWTERVQLLQVNRQAKSNFDYVKSRITSITFKNVKNFSYIRDALNQLANVDKVVLKRKYLSQDASFSYELQNEELLAIRDCFKGRILQHLDITTLERVHTPMLMDFFSKIQMAPLQLLHICGSPQSMTTDLPGLQFPIHIFNTMQPSGWLIPRFDFSRLRVLSASSLCFDHIDSDHFNELLKGLPLETLTTIPFVGYFFNKANWESLTSRLSASQTLRELVIANYSERLRLDDDFIQRGLSFAVGHGAGWAGQEIDEREILSLLSSLNSPDICKISIHVSKKIELEEIKDLVKQKLPAWPKLQTVLIHDFFLRTMMPMTRSEASYLSSEETKIGPYNRSFTFSADFM